MEVGDVLGVDVRDFLGVEVRYVLGAWGAVCAKIQIASVNINR